MSGSVEAVERHLQCRLLIQMQSRPTINASFVAEHAPASEASPVVLRHDNLEPIRPLRLARAHSPVTLWGRKRAIGVSPVSLNLRGILHRLPLPPSCDRHFSPQERPPHHFAPDRSAWQVPPNWRTRKIVIVPAS